MDATNQHVQLADHRYLGFAEYGAARGIPVFHFHGSASSRLERPASEEILKTLDIRFISVDRPGHGASDFQPGRCLTDWAEDISGLADHLGIQKFFVTGHSAGGPHALACAYGLPERVKAGAALSSVAPMHRKGAFAGMPFLNQMLARASHHAPWVTRQVRRIMRNMVMGDVEQATRQVMGSIPDSDKDALYDPKNIAILVASIREGFSQGYTGVAQDDILINTDWDFALEHIRPRIDIWHGENDVNVPIHAGKYLAAKIPNNRTMFLADRGHFFVLNQWSEILRMLLNDS